MNWEYLSECRSVGVSAVGLEESREGLGRSRVFENTTPHRKHSNTNNMLGRAQNYIAVAAVVAVAAVCIVLHCRPYLNDFFDSFNFLQFLNMQRDRNRSGVVLSRAGPNSATSTCQQTHPPPQHRSVLFKESDIALGEWDS